MGPNGTLGVNGARSGKNLPLRNIRRGQLLHDSERKHQPRTGSPHIL
jgi:hypothetical protein